MKSKVDDLIEHLKGTCNSLYDGIDAIGLKSIDDLSLKDLRLLDDTIFLCDTCGWWNDIDDLFDDNICTSCSED